MQKDDPVQRILETNPLLRFSLYTDAQLHALNDVGNEIVGLCADWPDDMTNHHRVYNLFWLWVLGAYEVVRTMDQHRSRFSPHVADMIGSQKRYLAGLWMPFAKQELKGDKKIPIYAENSYINVGIDGLCFEVSGKEYWSGLVIKDFLADMTSIKAEDIQD